MRLLILAVQHSKLIIQDKEENQEKVSFQLSSNSASMKDRLQEETAMSLGEAEPGHVLHLPVTIKDETIYNDSISVLEKIRPDWFRAKGDEKGDKEQIQMRVFSGGITNKLVGFYLDTDKDDIVIVKLYGQKTEMFINRSKEIKTMQLLHERKCGPILYAIFENGIAYEYSPGVTLSMKSCRSNSVYPLVAKEVARMHSIPLSPSEYEQGSSVWKMTNNFYELSVEALETRPAVKERFGKSGFTPEFGRLAIDELQALCAQESIPLAFCHNDLLLGNIIYNEERATIAFIDFEYAATNYVAFDIANHFNEFAGIEDPDFSLCPDEEFQREWIQEYVKHYKNPADGGPGSDPEAVFYWVQLCIPLSHLFWGLWAAVQACYSTIDFDFAGYCELRLEEYKKGIEAVRRQRKTINGESD